jgi:drug/metabolite transporter (DMT)-like permease
VRAQQRACGGFDDRATQPRLAVELGFLVLLAVLWGASHTLIKVAVETISPLTIVAARVTVAAVLLVMLARHRHLSFPSHSNMWGMLVVQAFLLNLVPFTLITWGQQFIDSGLAGVLNSTPPIFTFMVTLLLTRHEPATPQKLLGVLCGLGGVAMIVGIEALHSLGTETLGQLAVIGASLCYGFAAVNGRRLAPLSPIVSAAGTMACSAIFMLPLSVLVERPWNLSASSTSLLAVGGLAVFSTAGATIVYFRLLSTLGSIGTSSNSYLRAAVSVLLGMIFLGERPGWTTFPGLMLIVIAITAINGQLGWLRPRARARLSQSGP